MAYQTASIRENNTVGRFHCLKSLWLPYLENIAYIDYDVHNAWMGKRTWLVILTVFSKLKDFARSQFFCSSYTANVVNISEKVSFLLETISMKWKWVIYSLLNSGNSDDLEWPSGHSPIAFSNVIFLTDVQQLTRFQLTQCVARSLCDSWAS